MTVGVTDGVTVVVANGVTVGVTEGVTVGVADGVTVGVADGDTVVWLMALMRVWHTVTRHFTPISRAQTVTTAII